MIEIHVIHAIPLLFVTFIFGMMLEFVSPTQTTGMIRKAKREKEARDNGVNVISTDDNITITIKGN